MQLHLLYREICNCDLQGLNIQYLKAGKWMKHPNGIEFQRMSNYILTNHSLWPWNPSWLSLFTATTMPAPGLVAMSEFSSIHPLKTEPKPPSPNTLSGRKFLVAVLSSLKPKLFKLEACNISPSVRGVWGMEVDENLLLDLLRSFSSLLTFFELAPTQTNPGHF